MKFVKSPVSRRGFTLIEVMVSTAIMIVIVLAVVTIASDTFKAYDRAVADLTTQSEARGVLDAMEGDFQSAMIRPDGRCWMEVTIPGNAKSVPGATTTKSIIGDVQAVDQPIIMLFASPPDRPRWAPSTTSPRVALKGDVCAIAYRIGQSSPFDAPGQAVQQVYGVYRTIIDPENTFKEAIPLIMTSTAANPISPWDYWNGTSGTKRSFANYSDIKADSRALIDFTQNASTPCWTLDQSNFIASNVVAMNFTFWCTSSLPDSSTVAGARTDPLKRPAQLLRPVIAETTDLAFKFSATGYPAAYSASTTAGSDSNAASLRWTDNKGVGGAKTPHPYDSYVGRLRIYSDRIYPDSQSPSTTIASSTTALPYLPYTLKAIEVSLTILTPEGSKELRGLQMLDGNAQSTQGVTLKTNASYKRIVNQYGRNYTRYIRLLGNGGG